MSSIAARRPATPRLPACSGRALTIFEDSSGTLSFSNHPTMQHEGLLAEVAEVEEPREALLRLRDQLASLEERLIRQENNLRGASEDVARGIDVQSRKARGQGQLNRLNKNLKGVGLGPLRACSSRGTCPSRNRSTRFSGAMVAAGPEGGACSTTASTYTCRSRSAAARGRTGRLRIQRASRQVRQLAALMMVILTEWERDANTLLGRKSAGSLRFLFLDEANRLSHENLGVLFTLCQTLDLQFLIVAPEVAHAEGNTTYLLVRRTTGDAREEVFASGRRTRAEV